MAQPLPYDQIIAGGDGRYNIQVDGVGLFPRCKIIEKSNPDENNKKIKFQQMFHNGLNEIPIGDLQEFEFDKMRVYAVEPPQGVFGPHNPGDPHNFGGGKRGRKGSRKGSRKSRRASRKSRRASRKSRRASRKSRSRSRKH